MAGKRKATSQIQRTKGLDYRSPYDEAWYSVRLLKVEEGVLRVMYVNFPEDSDEWYTSDQFVNPGQIDELMARFRIPSEQMQDTQCGEVVPGMVVVACHTFPTGELLYFDAVVDSVSRSKHTYNRATEEQVCTCQFHVTWKYGSVAGKHATLKVADICLTKDLPVEDLVLNNFICSARKSLEERIGNLADHRASPHPANLPESMCAKSSDDSHHHEGMQEIEKSYEATKPQNTSGGEASKSCFFFWVDNVDENIDPPTVVKFLQRELSVSSQVVMFPNLFLSNTNSGAIYVESSEHATRVLKFLTNPDNIIVSLIGRPWVTNKRCCGIYHRPMPWKEVNLDAENQGDASRIRVLRPGSDGYEEARKMRNLFSVHCDRIEALQQKLRSEEMELRNSLAK